MDQGRAAEWLSNLSGANALMGGLAGRFDGHAHIFRSDLPMASPRRYTPDYHAEPKTYCQHLQEHDLDGAILVQPSFLGADNSYMLDQMVQMDGKDGLTFRAVVVLDPQDKSLDRAALEDFSARGVIGLRLNVVGKSDTEVADLSDWESLVRLADQLGWHVELHCEGPRLAKPLSQLLSWSQQVVVDHFGLPDASNPLSCDGMAAMTYAPAEQLFVKCSAPYRVFPDLSVAQAAEQIKPVFTHLAEHLGPEHLLWGSDWPHTRYEAKQCFADSVNWMTGM